VNGASWAERRGRVVPGTGKGRGRACVPCIDNTRQPRRWQCRN